MYLVLSILHVADRDKLHACCSIYDERSYRALAMIALKMFLLTVGVLSTTRAREFPSDFITIDTA